MQPLTRQWFSSPTEMALIGLQVPKIKPATARTRKVSKPGPGVRRKRTTKDSGRNRRIPKRGRYLPRPPEPGAPDITLATLSILRSSLARALVIVLGALEFWRRENSRRKAPSGPFGPDIGFTLPTGWGVVGITTTRERAFSAGVDLLNLVSDNPFDSGYQTSGGFGPLFPVRMRQTTLANDGVGGDAAIEDYREGSTGQDWEPLDGDGNVTGGPLRNGSAISGLRLPSGAYRWMETKTVLSLYEPGWGPREFPTVYDPTEPGEPLTLPEPFTLPSGFAPSPLIDAPADPAPADVPKGDPVPERAPETTPSAPPLRRIAPSPAGSPAPLRSGDRGQVVGTPVQPENFVQPVPIPLPRQTPVEQVKVGDQLIGGPAKSPAPDLPSMAQELGRIEQKTEALLRRPAGGGGGEALEDFLRAQLPGLIRDLLREIFNDRPGGQYQLIPPCGRPGPDGEPVPEVVSWAASSDPMTDLGLRVDALAELLQVHKNQRQPICRGGRAEGTPVTVLFEELPP